MRIFLASLTHIRPQAPSPPPHLADKCASVRAPHGTCQSLQRLMQRSDEEEEEEDVAKEEEEEEGFLPI